MKGNLASEEKRKKERKKDGKKEKNIMARSDYKLVYAYV